MMKEYRSLLEEALETWGWTRLGVIEEVENLPERDFGFRPASGGRSATELVQHIIESGLMMAGELTRPGGDFGRKSFEKLLREHAPGMGRIRTKGALVKALRRTHADGEMKFVKAGELAILQYIRRFDGKAGTRLAWFYHGISHEEYHRGQLATYARLLGHVPALTQRITGS